MSRGFPSRLSGEAVDLAVSLRESGQTIPQIRERLAREGVHLSTGAISWQLLRHGADAPVGRRRPTPKRGVTHRGGSAVRPFTPSEDATLLEMDAQGARISDIAKAIGRASTSTASRILVLTRHQARAEDMA